MLVTILFASTKFDDAYAIYKDGEFEKSLAMFDDLAKDGDYDAAYILAFMYEHGEGCEVNKELSASWYKISSKGYYNQVKRDLRRDGDKEMRKLYESVQKSDDIETRYTTRQYAESLYNIKAYKANYFLPVSYRHNGTYADTNGHEAKNIETEFQVSIKFDFSSNLLGLNEIYSAAYTQVAFWQLYLESAYFRETNYNPELYVTFPISLAGDGKFIKAVKLAYEHESNGRGGDDERSWNILTSSLYFQYKDIFAELKLWHRLSDKNDYNPDLIDYMGHGHIQFMLPYKKNLLKVLLRHSFSNYSAFKLDYSYPIFGRKDLFLYMKAFSGYGESLIDYNNHVNKIGVGLSISR